MDVPYTSPIIQLEDRIMNHEKINCPICNKEFSQITNTHLKKHNLTLKAFREKYPDYLMSSTNLIESRQKGVENWIKKGTIYNKLLKEENILTYNLNPKLCKECNKPLSYDKKYNEFCSRSCSALFSNRNRVISDEAKLNIRNGRMKFLGYEKEKLTRKCPNCLKKFEVELNPTQIENNEGKKFCSQVCARKVAIKKAIVTNVKNKVELSKKISKTRKSLFKEGLLNVTGGTACWIPYKHIKVQGTYEFRMCHILDYMLKNNFIESWEYTNDRIEYIGLDNKKHSYLLDFKVYENNSFYYIETKGYSTETDKLKWDAVRNQGYILKVLYNEDIKALESKFGINRN